MLLLDNNVEGLLKSSLKFFHDCNELTAGVMRLYDEVNPLVGILSNIRKRLEWHCLPF